MLQRHWYMPLLAVDWTTATAYLLVSVVNCYRSYKWSRTLPPVLLRGRENANVWLLSYGLTWAPLAANPTADHFQDSSSGIGLQASTWCGSTVSAIVLWADVNVYWSSSPAFCTDETAGRSHEQGRNRSRTSRLEQSSCWAESSRYFSDCFQKQI